jgi:magnesium transporter
MKRIYLSKLEAASAPSATPSASAAPSAPTPAPNIPNTPAAPAPGAAPSAPSTTHSASAASAYSANTPNAAAPSANAAPTPATVVELDEVVNGCLVNMVNPTEQEMAELATRLAIDPADLRAPLDAEERSRVTEEDGYVLVIIDIPVRDMSETSEDYTTIPLGIILTDEAIVTTCLEDTPLITDFLVGQVRNFYTYKKTRFVLQLLHRIAGSYLDNLRIIDTQSVQIERRLHRSMRNRELIDLLGLEKSLMYFTTSLRSNQRVLDKLVRLRGIKKYPDDDELLEDTIEENRQAMEMAEIYSGVLGSMMDAFASVISNNQNMVMKVLALITIIMSIPTMIFSAYGMNVAGEGMPFSDSIWGFAIVIAIAFALSALATMIFFIKKWF